MTGGWRILRIAGTFMVSIFQHTPQGIRGLAGHVARMGDMKNAECFVRETERKRPVRKPDVNRDEILEVQLKQMCWEL
jgi:hypothetical protein